MITSKLRLLFPPFSFFCRYSSTVSCHQVSLKTFERTVFNRPDLDFDYLLNVDNIAKIKENIKNRKQVGDIEKVHHIWSVLKNYLTNLNSLNSSQAANVSKLWTEFYEQALMIPNKTCPHSPIGDENQAKIVCENGEKRVFKFKPRTAEDLLSSHQTLRFDMALECGEKAYALFDKAAILEHCLIEFALDYLKNDENFRTMIVPDILNVDTARKCGLLPPTSTGVNKTLFTLKNKSEYCLSGTAEMGIASYLENEILNIDELPAKFVAVSRCYRPEVASSNIQKGLYRVHEFTKVEMFAVTANELGNESDNMLEYFVGVQKSLFSKLNLHFKVLDMPSQELGAPAYRKYDVEAWMPGRNLYGEVMKPVLNRKISSASNCTDFQSRRLSIRYKDQSGNVKFAHTINGTACASSRLLIALTEQHQKHNSGVDVPDCIKRFTDKYSASKIKNKPLKMHKCRIRTTFD